MFSRCHANQKYDLITHLDEILHDLYRRSLPLHESCRTHHTSSQVVFSVCTSYGKHTIWLIYWSALICPHVLMLAEGTKLCPPAAIVFWIEDLVELVECPSWMHSELPKVLQILGWFDLLAITVWPEKQGCPKMNKIEKRSYWNQTSEFIQLFQRLGQSKTSCLRSSHLSFTCCQHAITEVF